MYTINMGFLFWMHFQLDLTLLYFDWLSLLTYSLFLTPTN